MSPHDFRWPSFGGATVLTRVKTKRDEGHVIATVFGTSACVAGLECSLGSVWKLIEPKTIGGTHGRRAFHSSKWAEYRSVRTKPRTITLPPWRPWFPGVNRCLTYPLFGMR